MAERDKVIKSGQLTLPRILFLGVVGGVIVFTVYAGGIFLTLGYWFLTIAICGLLFLIAIDYGVAGVPESFVVGPDGQIVGKFPGAVTKPEELTDALNESSGG